MKHEKKIILDRLLKTDFSSNIYKQGEIYVFCSKNITASKPAPKNVQIIKVPEIDNHLDLNAILKKVYAMGIMSIFVEAGGILCGSFLPYADKIYQFIAPKVLADNNGKSCFEGTIKNTIQECKNFSIDSLKKISVDVLITYSSKM